MENIKKQLEELGQAHVLRFWDQLNVSQQKELQVQLSQWDLKDVCATFRQSINELNEKKTAQEQHLQPLPSDRYLDRSTIDSNHLDRLKQIGLNAIVEGKVAAIVLAGGQGTRLGSSKPKGMFNIELPSNKSLFRIQAERLLKLQQLAKQQAKLNSLGDDPKLLHLFVMTSAPTHQETVEYFEQEQYFGLEKHQVHFLQQSVMPCFTLDGEFLLADRHRLAESPDGNGGLYTALDKSGTLAFMRQLGITHVHVYCVDNVLVRVADPAFVGFVIERNLAAAAKAVDKRSADEPVGVFGLVNNRLRVLEYSEITREQSELIDADGKLTYRFGNICNHLFTVDFLQTVANSRLPQHVAKKKIPHLDLQTAQLIKPDKVNGVKLEKFIFDVFELTNDFGIWIVSRSDEFSPVKNSPQSNEDSPVTAKNDLYQLNARFVQQANGTIQPDTSGAIVCEISPLLTYEGENLAQFVDGKTFTSPLVLYDSSENKQNIINYVN